MLADCVGQVAKANRLESVKAPCDIRVLLKNDYVQRKPSLPDGPVQRILLKVTAQLKVEEPDVNAGHFNRCEHLFVELTPGEYQTISVKLPNGKHVTFGFVPGRTPEDFECVDIHSTVGKHWRDSTTVGEDHYEQKLIGFAKEGETFDTRKLTRKTGLATLLLGARHHSGQREMTTAKPATPLKA